MVDARSLALSLGGTWNGKSGKAKCPAHDDTNPSLDITEIDGRCLFICRAGCTNDVVLDALMARGLWQPASNGKDHDTLRHPDLGVADEEYRYLDSDNNLVGVICRWNETRGRSKEIRPATREEGHWRWHAFPPPRPLFHLPDILADLAKPILVVEGEKTAASARLLITSHVVTTWPGGTSSVQHADISPLKNRDCVLWPDNDEPGRKAMRKLADRLTDAKSVRGVKLPEGLPNGWDLGDPIPVDLDPVALIGRARDMRLGRLALLPLISGDELLAAEYKPIRWAVPDLVPEGLVLLAGDPKAGKSWLALDLCAAVATGGLALGNIECEEGDVLLLALEDSQRRLQARLRAVMQGTRPIPRLTFSTKWRRADDGGVDDLRTWLQLHPEARLIVIDTRAVIKGESRNRDQGVYDADYMTNLPFKELADERHCAIILVHHNNKAKSGSDPLSWVSGTNAITASADTILVLEHKYKETTGILHVQGRDVLSDEVALQFEKESGRWLRLGPAEDFRRSEERRALIRLLSQSSDPMTPIEIASTLGRNRGAVRRLIGKMHKGGEIERLPNGKYYILKE